MVAEVRERRLSQLRREEVRVPGVAAQLLRKEHLTLHLVLEELGGAASKAKAVHGEVHDRIGVLSAERVNEVFVEPGLDADAERQRIEADVNHRNPLFLLAVVVLPELGIEHFEIQVGDHFRHRVVAVGDDMPDDGAATPAVDHGVLGDLKFALGAVADAGIWRDRNRPQVAEDITHLYQNV